MPSSTEREAKLVAARNKIIADLDKMDKEFDLTPLEIMKLLAFMTGAALAGQDQRAMSADQYMKLIYENVIGGNHDAIAAFIRAPGGRA